MLYLSFFSARSLSFSHDACEALSMFRKVIKQRELFHKILYDYFLLLIDYYYPLHDYTRTMYSVQCTIFNEQSRGELHCQQFT